MNVSYGGPQCVAVALNPGGSSFDPSGLYVNITDLQTSNSSTNTRVNSLNTSIQNLLTTNTTIFSALLHLSYNDTYMNGSINNLLTSNTSIYSSLLHLSYNDTNLNTSINAVNTRATTINNTLVIVQQNVTELQTSNLTKAPITSITSLNASINTLSTFAQTKAATGYSGDCPTGISGITLNNGTAPNKTCAPAQSGGSGMTGFGISSGGTNASMSNSSTFYLYPGSGITINVSSATPYPGATFTASAGGGNVSGGSVNGTLGFLAMWNATSTITNTSVFYNRATGILYAGSGTPGTITTAGGLYVPGDVEIDGNTYFDNSMVVANGARLQLGQVRFTGNSGQGQFLIGTTNGNGNQIVIGSDTYIASDFGHAAATNPTLFIHSNTDPASSTTQWIGITHNTTDGVISTGLGAVKIDSYLYRADEYRTVLAATYNTTVIALNYVPTMNVTLIANKNYSIKCDLYGQTAATSTGMNVTFSGSQTNNFFIQTITYKQVTLTTENYNSRFVYNTTVASTGVVATANPVPISIDAFISVGGTNTNLYLMFGSEVAASAAALLRGSTCVFRDVTSYNRA
jgi:hypothetical protein